jgi:hypothetical protein
MRREGGVAMDGRVGTFFIATEAAAFVKGLDGLLPAGRTASAGFFAAAAAIGLTGLAAFFAGLFLDACDACGACLAT